MLKCQPVCSYTKDIQFGYSLKYTCIQWEKDLLTEDTEACILTHNTDTTQCVTCETCDTSFWEKRKGKIVINENEERN